MADWVAEYLRGDLLFNVREIQAESQADAEFIAWECYQQLAKYITITVFKIIAAENNTALSERRDAAPKGKRQNLRRAA